MVPRCARPGRHLARDAGALQPARRGLLGGHARSRRQPEHRRAAAARSKPQPPFAILDFGCGPGRDLQAFASRPRAVGLDGAAPFVAMARAHSGCEVWQQDFLALDLPPSASTAYSPMPRCSTCRHASCRGCCASCMPRSSPAACCSVRTRAATTRKAGTGAATAPITISRRGAATCWPRVSTELEHYYRPAGLPRDQQPWLASVWRK